MIENDISSEMRGMLLVTCGNSLLPFLWLLILEEDVWIDTKSLVIFDTLLFFFNTYVDLPAYSPVYKTTDWWFSNHWTFLQNLPQGNNVFVNLALLWLHSPAADCLSLSHGLAVWEPPPWGTGCETWFPHWGKEKKRLFCLVCCGLGLLTSQEHTNLSFLFSPLSCSVYSGYLWSFYATLCWHMVSNTGKEYREILSKKSLWQLDFAQYLWIVAPATFFCLFPETMIVLIKYILERICACYCSVCKDQLSLPYMQCAISGLCSTSSFVLWLCCLLTLVQLISYLLELGLAGLN